MSLSRLSRPVLAVLLVPLTLLPGCENPVVEGKRVGNVCPEIAGADPDGKEIRLSHYRGKVVLVNFWATWCGPCRKLLPHERQMVESQYRDRPFVLLGVAIDEPDMLGGFLKANPLPWPNIADGNPGIISRQWNVDGVPSAVLVDHNGIIRRRWLDGMDPDAVWAAVEKAVQEAERK